MWKYLCSEVVRNKLFVRITAGWMEEGAEWRGCEKREIDTQREVVDFI